MRRKREGWGRGRGRGECSCTLVILAVLIMSTLVFSTVYVRDQTAHPYSTSYYLLHSAEQSDKLLSH